MRAARRGFLQLALAGLIPRPAVAQASPPATGTQLVLLGTKGGPTPSPDRAAPSSVLIVDGRPYVVDCGNGVAIQLTKAGVRLATVDNVFVAGQNPVARWLIRMDRGQNVREVAGYRALFGAHERNVTHDVRHDLLKIPYSHIIMQLTKP